VIQAGDSVLWPSPDLARIGTNNNKKRPGSELAHLIYKSEPMT